MKQTKSLVDLWHLLRLLQKRPATLAYGTTTRGLRGIVSRVLFKTLSLQISGAIERLCHS